MNDHKNTTSTSVWCSEATSINFRDDTHRGAMFVFYSGSWTNVWLSPRAMAQLVQAAAEHGIIAVAPDADEDFGPDIDPDAWVEMAENGEPVALAPEVE